MKLQQILHEIRETKKHIDAGQLAHAKNRLDNLEAAMSGAQQVNVIKEDSDQCPSCETDGKKRRLFGTKPQRHCNECGWRES